MKKVILPGVTPFSEPNLTVNAQERCVMARFRRQGKLHQQNFTLRQYGTWKKAMAAGRKWTKEQRVLLPEPSSNRGRKTTRNKSGFVGVRFIAVARQRNGQDHPDVRWVATWPGCSRVGGISFSVQKYGDQQAFILAYLARELETLDRDWLECQGSTFLKTKAGRKVLDRKLQSAMFEGQHVIMEIPATSFDM